MDRPAGTCPVNAGIGTMNAEHLTALREAAKALRKVKTDIEAVLTAMENERTLLPERLWRTLVDDDMIETEVSMGELVGGSTTRWRA